MRLIDIEPFETEANITSCYIQRTHSGDGFVNVAQTNTNEIPAIDAVEVVRWKDCKHLYFKDMSAYCPFKVSACRPNGFCSLGERRNDG